MLAHKKLWESGIEYIKEAEEILKPLQAPYWGHQTSKEEFLTMREDMNPQLAGNGKYSLVAGMWQLFFALYFASEETIIADKGSIPDTDKYIEV